MRFKIAAFSLFLVFLIAGLFVGISAVSADTDYGEAGSEDDPVVTKSYVERVGDEKFNELEQEIKELENQVNQLENTLAELKENNR